ncbi:MAG: T9SS type A sorting domain-containing protein, partial [Paludibacter sp.]
AHALLEPLATDIVALLPRHSPNSNYVEIREVNGSWDTKPASWANKVVGQITKIIDIIGDKLILEDKLRISFEANLSPEIQKIKPREHVRIENLCIERIDNSKEATANNFQFNYAVNCMIAGVESSRSQGSHAKISLSSHIEITGSYFHHAFMYDGVGTKGYGVVLDSHSGLCLVTNNIFRHLRHAMMTKDGANGNVFAYNYSTDVYRNGANEFPSDFGGDISLHGHYSFANLFEANIVQNIVIDEYWGANGPMNTFFRNRVENYGIFMSTTQTNNTNFVGNEVVGSIPFGFFMTKGTGNFIFANNRNGKIYPTATSQLSDSSYYYNSIPTFWDIPDKWPSIGISNSLNEGIIPAKNRFNTGIYTVPTDELLSGPNKIINFNRTVNNNLEVIPNPASQYVFVDIDSSGNMKASLIFTDLQGKVMKYGDFYFTQKGKIRKTIDISGFSVGVYFMKLMTDNGIFTQKLIVR